MLPIYLVDEFNFHTRILETEAWVEFVIKNILIQSFINITPMEFSDVIQSLITYGKKQSIPTSTNMTTIFKQDDLHPISQMKFNKIIIHKEGITFDIKGKKINPWPSIKLSQDKLNIVVEPCVPYTDREGNINYSCTFYYDETHTYRKF
jgi:hypothetical protein